MRGLSPSALTAVAGVTALVASFKGLTSSLKGAIDNFSHFESMQKGLETFFQSAEKGKAKFEELRKLSNETTFGVDELADSFTQLANVGVNVDTINDKLMMLGNISGGNKQKFAELVQIYSKIQSTGKAGAMQIQQLASRGVPIYDMLKKIGVQGTATGEDITKAFQEMTKEGGQFYNAMNNINDTIEGKEGFISDYFKEMTVNFTEVTGIADAYKAVLDIVREAIGTVSDKLKELNENPIAKTLISGAFIGLLTTMATLIGVTIVGALKSVNARLRETVILKSILDPKTLGIALLVGGVVGLGVALKKVAETQKEVVENAGKIQTQMQNNDQERYYDSSKNAVEKYQEKLNAITERIEELKKKKDELLTEFNTNAGVTSDEYKDFVVGQIADEVKKTAGVGEYYSFANENVIDEMQKVTDELTELQRQSEQYSNWIKVENGVIGQIDTIKDRTEAYRKLSESVTEYYDKMSGKDKLDSLQSQLKETKDLFNLGGQTIMGEDGNEVMIKFTDSQKKEIEKLAEYLKESIENQKYKIAVDTQSGWQKQLQSAFGFTNKEVYGGATNSTVGAINTFKEVMEKQGQLLNSLTGKNDDSYRKAMYEKIVSAFDETMKSVREGTYSGTEESLKTFAKEVENANKELDKISLNSINKNYINDLTMNSILDGGKSGVKSAKQTMMSSLEKEIRNLIEKGFNPMSTEVQNLVETYKQLENETMTYGEKFDKFIDNLKSSDNVGSMTAGVALESFVSASSDATNFMQGFAQGGVIGGVISTLIGAFMEVAQTCDGFDKAMNPVSNAMKQLKPTIELLLKGGEKIAEGFEMIFAAIESIFDALSPVIELLNDMLELLQFPIAVIARLITAIAPLLKNLFAVISAILKALSFGLLDAMKDFNDSVYDSIVTLDEKNQKEKDMLSQYQNLLKAMKDQEEWYLRNKTALNAETRKDSYSVNDMILTPHGTFSTHPQDTIIAMKHPEQLGSNQSVILQPIVNDYGGNDVQIRQESDGNGRTQLIVDISKKIAQDVANGNNGWDSALNQRNTRLAGRRVSL